MSGSRTTAILLHGLCSTPEELMPVQATLRGAGHGVLPMRIAGYSFDAGRTEQQARPYGQWIAAVAEQAKALHAEGRRVVIVGISAGATLALAAAMRAPAAVDGLVLMSIPLVYDGWAIPKRHVLMPLALYTPLGRLWQYREQPPYGVKNVRVRAWIERELATRRVSCAGAAVIGVPHLREHDRLRRKVRRRLADFDCPPVLALHAVEDEVASPSNVTLLQNRLRTPSFRAVLLPDSHHMITIDNDRQQVASETLAFVAAIDAPSQALAERDAAALTP